MQSSLQVIGTNFKHAELDQVALVQWPAKDQISLFLKAVRTHFQIEEIFFLQTCNRREFYFYGSDLKHRRGFFDEFLGQLSASLNRSFQEHQFYHYRGKEAAKHLFGVASSLDSMVLGETEIIKQIKDQSAAALKFNNLGRRLKSLVEVALWVSKQVRQKTQITRNVVSLASLAYRKVVDHMAVGKRNTLVFVGAGHFISSLLPTFKKAAALEFLFVNRTLPAQLARDFGGRAMTLSDFLQSPPPFDAMITATSAPGTLFDHDWVSALGRDVLLLDAALPRDIDPRVGQRAEITYLDLNQMEKVLTENRAARKAEIPKTEPIFAEGFQKLGARWLECELAAYNRQISAHYRDAGERALNHLIKEELTALSDSEQEKLRGWTQDLVTKLTKIPVLGLKGVARDVGDEAVEAFTRGVADKSSLFRP